MKKTTSILISLFVALNISAQINNVQKDVQKNVKEIYAHAMELINMQKEEPNTANYMSVTTKRMEAGIGKCEYATEYYSTLEDGTSEDFEKTGIGPVYYKLFFMREKKTYIDAIMEPSYTEYLYHPVTGKMIFCFTTDFSYYAEEPAKIETRYYFTPEGKYAGGIFDIKSQETGKKLPIIDEIEIDEESIARHIKNAQKRFEAFNNHMN